MFLGSCDQQDEPLFSKIQSEQTGIKFSNDLSQTPNLNILTYLYYYNGGGIAAGDFNNDGYIDLYFTGNQVADKLYLNLGDFQFKDVTKKSAISNDDGWTTGVTIVDINSDGLLDLYVCKANLSDETIDSNLLLINLGVDDSGIPLFEDRASDYGLNFTGLSTHAGFFDFDLDNDLDMYLLNHSTHPNRSYGKGLKRLEMDSVSGDRLFENRNGKFIDVSHEAGIYQGSIGYGLGLSFGDLNDDGYPDIYVGNDFFENDYLYINNGDGTFSDLVLNSPSSLGHTSHYSMGNSVADLNNDGKSDILSLDMLPEDLATYKSSGSEDPFSTYSYYLKNGYSPQYMQNTLHLNVGGNIFKETANYSGITATEWSWSVLAADFDLDGMRDLYISNGIKGATNDMDFISFIAQEKIQKQLGDNMTEEGMKFISELPKKKLKNYAFRNVGDAEFKDESGSWFSPQESYSNGAVFVDLDNDGDLDIVVNNVDEPAFVFRNSAHKLGRNYLSIDFKGPNGNANGIGTRVVAYAGGLLISEENYPTRSYLSSVAPEVFLGLGDSKVIDSLQIIWPDRKSQMLYSVPANQKLTVMYEEGETGRNRKSKKNYEASVVNSDIQIAFSHEDVNSLEFERQPLIPFAKGYEGPALAVGDSNNDGLDDVFFGGGKWQSSKLFVQGANGSYTEQLIEDLSKQEVTDALFFDSDGDGDQDLILAMGGNEFWSGDALYPILLRNEGGNLIHDIDATPKLEINVSKISSIDLEKDGDQDLIFFSNTVPNEFGMPSQNFTLLNDGEGNFSQGSNNVVTEPFIEDAQVIDINGDGLDDLVTVSHWGEPTFFMNEAGKLSKGKAVSTNSSGWWNAVQAADFDNDGDVDIMAGNWGLNTRLKASEDEPVTLYRYDFDQNEKVDPILTYFYKGEEITLASKMELTKQLPYLNKRYLSYQAFANASFEEILGKEKLEKASKLQVEELASCYFENQGNDTFVKRLLPKGVQLSSVHDIEVADFNKDGYLDALFVGNTFEISTQLGRLDASHGVLLLNDKVGFFKESEQTFDVAGAARDIEKITIAGIEHWVVGMNNGKPVFLKRSENEQDN